MWYNTQSNESKIAIEMFPNAIKKFIDLLEENNLNYYGYDNGKLGKISINKDDLEIVKSLVGDKVASSMKTENLAKSYTPPEKNIFGTIDYKYIARNSKRYITGESELEQKAILRTAELLSRQGIKFSGRVYENKVTLTLNEQDLSIATDTYNTVLSILQKTIQKIEEDRLNEKLSPIKEVFREIGFSEEQTKELQTLIIEFSNFENVDVYDYIAQLNPEYTIEQNSHLMERLKDIYKNGGIDYLQPSERLSVLFDVKNKYNLDIELRSYLSNHNYTEEQAKVIKDIVDKESSIIGVLTEIDESFDPQEIEHLYSLYRNAVESTHFDMTDINKFMDNHLKQQHQLDGVVADYSDAFFVDKDKQMVTWIYHNPDSSAGRQFVTNEFSFTELLRASEFSTSPEEFFDYIEQSCKQHLSDVGTEYFDEALAEFNNAPTFTDCSSETLDGLVSIAKNDENIVFFGKWQFAATLIDKFTDDSELRSIYNENKDNFNREVKQRINEFADNLLSGKERIQGYSRSDIMQFIIEYKHYLNADKVQKEIEEAIISDIGFIFSAIENAKNQDKESDISFKDKIIKNENELNPVIYDGSITPENFEKTQESTLNDESEQESEVLSDTSEQSLGDKKTSEFIEEVPTKIKENDVNISFEQAPVTTPPVQKSSQLTIFEEAPLSVSISQDKIDYVLRCGGNNRDSLERIVSQFQKGKTISENAEFLKQEFDVDGRGYEHTDFDGTNTLLSAWFDNDGIRIAEGTTAMNNPGILLSWEQVAERISQLLENGEYTSQDIIDSAEDYEKDRIAAGLWYLHQDVTVEFFIPSEIFKGAFPEGKARIKENLSDKDVLQNYIDGLTAFIEQYKVNKNILRFHFHNLDGLLSQLKDLQTERLQFNTKSNFSFTPKYFITEDEKENLFNRGSNFSGQKFQIYEYFKQGHSAKEKADFLKQEYGTGGSIYSNSDIQYDSKVIKFAKGNSILSPDCSVSIKWNEAVKIIDKLISENRYLSKEDIERLNEYQKENKIQSTEIEETNIFNSVIEKSKEQKENLSKNTIESKSILSEYFSENNNLGVTLRNQFATDELVDIAYALGISNNSWNKNTHPIDTHENVAKREFSNVNRIISVDGIDNDIRLTANDTGIVFSLADIDCSYSWKEVGDSLYSAVLDYTLDSMYREIIAEAHNDKASIKKIEKESNNSNSISKIIHDARKTEVSNEYITFDEQEQRYNYIGDFKSGATKTTEAILNTFTDSNKLVDYLKENKYVLNGYGINTQAVLGMEFEQENVFDTKQPIKEEITTPEILSLDGAEKTLRPTITCEWSEHSAFEDGKTYSIAEFDELMKKADSEWIENRQKEIDTYGSVSKALEANDTYHQGYAKTKFTLNLPDGSSYTERQDIGDGNGGVIDYLKQYNQYSNIIPILLEDIKLDKPNISEINNAEKRISKSVDDLQVGDTIRIENEEWTISRIIDDFSIKLNNNDKNSIRSSQMFLGHWKQRITELGFEYIEPKQLGVEKVTPDIKTLTNSVDSINKDNVIKEPITEDKQEVDSSKELTITVSTVTVLGSEHPRLVENETYTLAEFNSLIEQLNYEWISNRQKEIHDYGSIDDAVSFGGNYQSFARTDFVINLPNGDKLPESINIGSDYGGLIDYLKTIDEYTDIIPKLEQAIDSELSRKIEKYEQLTLTVEEHPTTAKEKPQKDEKERAETIISSVPEQSSDKDNEKSSEDKLSDKSADEPAQEIKSNENIQKINYHITDNHIGEGTASERFKNNISAIKTLKKIESENRYATPEEQEILAKYVGWGGLSACFNEGHASYNQLKHSLTDEEFRAARASTLTAFYTPPVVMQSMYKALSNMGFDNGKILEPSCGIGNFIGTIPENMKNSNVHAVELDSISGRIAQQLYQTADIKITGFEKTKFNDNAFDVAIGNVPFGEIRVRDKQYDKYNWRIHNYFFGKSLDKVRPGGVVAFITSRYTLDSKSSSFREYLSERADLLGAIRLPNDTFKKAAGTPVVSDIIFLQKRDTPPEQTPDWVHTAENEQGFEINKFFISNPDMILGNLTECSSAYGRPDITVKPTEGVQLNEQLDKAIQNIKGFIPERSKELDVPIEKEQDENKLSVPENLRNYSFYVSSIDNQVYFKNQDNGFIWKKGTQNKTYSDRAKAFIELRDCTREILDSMVNNCSDEELHNLQNKLNTLYDNFYAKYGLVHSSYNKNLFKEDISYQLVASLEAEYNEKTLLKKSDLFTKRTIKPPVLVTSVDTAQEALTISLAEKGIVDLDFMAELYGSDKETIINELKGKIYPVPELSDDENIVYQDSSEYLSGDIRQKIENAKKATETNPILYSGNIQALENVLPEPLKAGDIDVKLGAAWIDPIYYQEFMYEVFKTPSENRADKSSIWRRSKKIELSYSKAGNSYHIENKSTDMSVFSTKTFGTKSSRANSYYIFENLLNLRDTKIYRTEYDAYGNEKRVIDIEKTKVAASKAEKIKKEFKEWIFKDPKRREHLVKKYNDMYNSIRPREFDGSGLTFPGMNAEITLRPHQKNAIAHALYGGNTLFAHSVGAGKTFEMIATAMESKRLGLCNKSLIVVPNHLTEQIGDDFQKLYPNANVLVATKADFKKENRRYLVSKIATGDFDAVVIGHSQLGKIPLSKEKQSEYIQAEIDELVEAIAEMKENDERSFSVKDAEKRKDNLEKRLADLDTKKDDIVTFEELGIDKIFVDEAHEFKNLYTPTKLNNVSGISHTASQKASDLYMKCRYLDEKTGNRGVTFATGTPISNSVTELFTMQKYLQHDLLKEKNLLHFDQWITLFGEQVTDHQIDPTGKKYKPKTRIANYSNMTELMSMFNCAADIKTSEMMNLDVPDCELHVVNVEPTEMQQDLVNELSYRADLVESGSVQPEDDNFLKITSDGRKVGLDPRLIDPSFEDNPNTKLNQCVENVLKIHKETAEEKLIQLIFCDLGVPKKNSSSKSTGDKDIDTENVSVSEQESFEDSGNFCIYDDIKEKLIAGGVSPNEIAYIHDAKTDKAKAELFEKCRKGEVRVLLGSTPKMGTGTNIQDKLVALHDLDVPWRPADLEQRRGRMVRQGNQNEKVHLYRYVTKGTFDAYSYQTLENKQRYISQIYTNKNQRTCQDVDQQSLSYAEIKTLCTGDERLKELMVLDNEVSNLNAMKRDYTNTVYEMQDKITKFADTKDILENNIKGIEKDIEICSALPRDSETGGCAFKINIGGTTYTDKSKAAKALEQVCNNAMSEITKGRTVDIATMHGFPITLKFSPATDELRATVNGSSKYSVGFSTVSQPTNIKRLCNVFDGLEQCLTEKQTNLARLEVEVKEAEKIVATPFEREQELVDKTKRRNTLKNELQSEATSKAAENKGKSTYYFSLANLHKNAQKCKEQGNIKDKNKEKKQGIGSNGDGSI